MWVTPARKEAGTLGAIPTLVGCWELGPNQEGELTCKWEFKRERKKRQSEVCAWVLLVCSSTFTGRVSASRRTSTWNNWKWRCKPRKGW